MRFIKNLVLSSVSKAGYVISRKSTSRLNVIELSEKELQIVDSVLDNKLTMVSRARLIATLMACKYVLENSIEGDFVECGVWRGGNAIVAAEMFKLYASEKNVWLFDTFQGMTQPTILDRDHRGNPAHPRYLTSQTETHNEWAYASLEEVTHNFGTRNLLGNQIHFVKGDVAKTLNKEQLPERISILRLDTDWYESTKVECEILYPKISKGGFLIVDDYGHWSGARQAVDEYFQKNPPKPFFHVTDYTGRIGVKPS